MMDMIIWDEFKWCVNVVKYGVDFVDLMFEYFFNVYVE